MPNVEKTLSRYLDAIRSFIPENDFATTAKHVQKFLQDKQAIQDIEARLKERAEREENWVSFFSCHILLFTITHWGALPLLGSHVYLASYIHRLYSAVG